MKFRFCGDLDCPDWVLAEIATISKISSIKAKQLCTLVATSLIVGEELKTDKITKLANDSKLEVNDIKACISLIEFILSSGAKYNINSETLSSELQQLGLPKEHSTSICKVYNDKHDGLRELLKSQSLRLNTLEGLDWRVDYIFGSSHMEKVNAPMANIKMKIKNACSGNIESHMISLDSVNLKLLIHEMKEARALMANLDDAISKNESNNTESSA